MPDTRIILSDMSGFPPPGVPIIMHPSGNIPIGITIEELMNTQLGINDQAMFYNSAGQPGKADGGGVRIIVRNVQNTASTYTGFSTYTEIGYSGFMHSTAGNYNQGGSLVYQGGTTYFGSIQSGGIHLVAGHASGIMRFTTGGEGTVNERVRIIASGLMGVFGTQTAFTPAAYIHLAAGTATAGNLPLRFTSGSLNTTAVAGGVEFLTDKFYGTITTGAARKELALNDIGLTSGRVPFVTTNGRLTDASTFTYATGTLTNSNTANSPVVTVTNAANGSGAYSMFMLQIAGSQAAFMSSTGASWTPSGIYLASQANVGSSQSAGLNVVCEHASGVMRFITGGVATGNERAQIDAAGNIRLCGTAALSTSATDGFVYMPSSAGTPSGTPTSVTGGVATEIDTTNSKFMAYIGGAWKGVTLT